jgi:hypothetical protein
MLGRDGQYPLFLQAREAEASVLERFVGRLRPGCAMAGEPGPAPGSAIWT